MRLLTYQNKYSKYFAMYDQHIAVHFKEWYRTYVRFRGAYSTALHCYVITIDILEPKHTSIFPGSQIIAISVTNTSPIIFDHDDNLCVFW